MYFGMEISKVLLFLLCCFESTVYTFLRHLDLFALTSLDDNKEEGFRPSLNIGNRYVKVAY